MEFSPQVSMETKKNQIKCEDSFDELKGFREKFKINMISIYFLSLTETLYITSKQFQFLC